MPHRYHCVRLVVTHEPANWQLFWVMVSCLYRVIQNKIPQHKNCDISEMREYFCTRFCSFVYDITMLKCIASCYIYFT